MALPEIERAAHLAAERAKTMLIDMLTKGEVGEVTIAVGLFELEPVKRVTTKGKAVKVQRGHVAIERVG